MKKKTDKFFHPKRIWIWIFIVLTIVLLIYSLGFSNPIPFIRYFSYLFSTYTLIVTILDLPSFIRMLRKQIKENSFYQNFIKWLKKNKVLKELLENIQYRNMFLLTITATLNGIFIFLKLRDGIMNHSIWSISLAIYYLLLVSTKSYLVVKLKTVKKHREGLLIYHKIGILLFLYNLFLSIMILQMILTKIPTTSNDYMIYLTALYSFYLIISAIIDIVKYRKYKSPILSSIKIVKLFTAFVSILMLQTTMIARFSSGDVSYMRLMNSITGGVVSLVVVVISFYMILKSYHEIKNYS